MPQLLQNAVYGTALILAVAALRGALRDRLLPEARLALWAVCLFRLLTPIAPTSALSFWGLFGWGIQELPVSVPAAPMAPTAPSAPTAPTFSAVSTAPMAPVAPIASTAPVAPTEAGIPWSAILAAVWIAVGMILAARFALAYVRTRRAVSRAVPLEREDVRYAALPKCARLREGPLYGAPLTFGVVRPTVVLSPGLEGTELACVLAHEGVHARRRDNLWHYAAAAALTVFWWDPAVWLMARLIRRDVELSCDRAAVLRLGAEKRAEYAHALVTLSTQAEGGAFCHGFGPKRTEERIIAVMKFKKTTFAGLALTLALVLAMTVGFASNPGEAKMDPDAGTDANVETNTQADPVLTPASVEEGWVRVNGDGFYYDMPADGWDPSGAYFLYSAYGTDSQVEIYGTGSGGFEGEVELYEMLGYTKTEETDGLTVLAMTDTLEFRDGTVYTAHHEVYIHGQKGPDMAWVVSLKWLEENLTAETANEPEIMRAIARSFTITTTGNQDEPHTCLREDCPLQPSVHFHEADGSVTYIYSQPPKYSEPETDDQGNEIDYCGLEGCTIQGEHFHHDPQLEDSAGDTDEPVPEPIAIICTLEDCPLQPSVHVHEADGSVTYVFNDCFIGG